MKKILIMLLVAQSIFATSNNIDELEDATLSSNVETVRSVLKSTELNESERYKLFKLAKDVLRQRTSLYSLCLPSEREFINILKGLGVSAIGLIGSLSLCVIAGIQVDGAFDKLHIILAIPPLICGLISVAGAGSLIATCIKHFYDFRKKWTNAIAIKSMFAAKNNNEKIHKINVSVGS